MAVQLIDIGDGQLAAAKATLFTFTGRGAARVTLVNTGAVARAIDIFLNRSGTSRRVVQKALSLGAGETVTTPLITANTGDLIEGNAAAANEVDYTVSGFEVV